MDSKNTYHTMVLRTILLIMICRKLISQAHDQCESFYIQAVLEH